MSDLGRTTVARRRPLCQIETDAGGWYDLTAVYDANGDGVQQDRFVGCTPIEVKLEAAYGVWDIGAVTLTFWNGDRFFNGAPPSGISSWYRRRVRLQEYGEDGAVTVAYLYTTDAPTTASDSDTATLPCESILGRLNDKLAARVRDGLSPYTNARVSTLVQAVLKQEFPAATVEAWLAAGALLARYQIPTASGERAVSHLGRLPETANVPGTFHGQPLAWHGTDNVLYVGVGNELWTWNPTTEAETRIGDLTDAGLGSDYVIQHLFYYAARGTLVGVAWVPDIPAATVDGTNSRDRSGATSGGQVRFFRWDGVTLEAWAAFSPPAGHQIYTGHAAVRAGGFTGPGAYTRIGGAGLDADSNGVSIPQPWSAWMRRLYDVASTQSNLVTTAGYASKAASFTTAGDASRTSHASLPSGWYFYRYDDGGGIDRRPLDYTWNCGQHQGAFALQAAGDYLAFCTIRWDSGSNLYRYRLYRLNCTSSAVAPTYEYYATSSGTWRASGGTGILDIEATLTSGGLQPVQPYALAFYNSDTQILVAGAVWKESAWSAGAPAANSVIGVLADFTWSAPTTVSNRFDGSGTADPNNYAGTAYATSIPMAVTPNTNGTHAWVSWFNIADFTWRAGVMALAGATTTDRVDQVRITQGPQLQAAFDADAGWFYWLDGASNVLVGVIGDDPTTLPSVVSDADAPVYQDGSVLQIVSDGGAPAILYGISAPGIGTQAQPDVNGTDLPGKYYLWQYHTQIADRVECFLYTGSETLKDALVDLARLCDAQIYPDLANDRVCVLLRPTPAAFTQVYTDGGLLLDETRDTFLETFVGARISAKPAMSEVINYVEMTPARVELGEPKYGGRILDRPTGFGAVKFDAPLQIAQHSVRTVSLVLRCTRGASAGALSDGYLQATDANHRLRFAYLEYGATVEASLLAATTMVGPSAAKISIPLGAAADLESGAVGFGDTVEYPDGSTRTLTAIDRTSTSGTAVLTLDSANPAIYAAGTHVLLRSSQHNRWSDNPAGVTLLALALPAAEPTINDAGGISSSDTTIGLSSLTGVDAGTVLRCGTEDIYVGGTSGSNATSCIRGYNGTTAASHADGAAITIRTVRCDSLTQLGLYAVLTLGANATREDLRYTGDTGDGVHGYVTRAVGGTSRSAHSVGDPVLAYWAPLVNSDYPASTMFGIGGTGVLARLDVPTTGGTAAEHPPMAGDEISITCPGLSLVRDGAAVVIRQDQTSIDRYQKRKWTGRASALASFRQCVEAAARIVDDQAWPHYLVVWDGPRYTTPDLRTTVGVRSPRELPWTESTTTPQGESWGAPTSPDTTREIACLPRARRVDLFGDALTLTLRAAHATTHR